jgi:hypothetical protein
MNNQLIKNSYTFIYRSMSTITIYKHITKENKITKKEVILIIKLLISTVLINYTL